MGTPYLCSSSEHKYGGQKLCKHLIHKFDQLFTANEQISPQTRFLILSSAGTGHRVLTTTSLEPQTGYTGTDSVEVLLDRFKIVLRPYPTTLESREI